MASRRGSGQRTASTTDAGGPNEIDVTERKERVLHTRVPQSLDRQLKRRARNLGLSVSTVVRHVLLNTFGLVEDIVTDSTNLALSVAGQDAEPERSSDIRRRANDGDENARRALQTPRAERAPVPRTARRRVSVS